MFYLALNVPLSQQKLLQHTLQHEMLSTTLCFSYREQDLDWIITITWVLRAPPFYASTKLRKLQFSSVAQSCPTLCNPMNHSTPGLPVKHQLLEFTQTHVHPVGDAILPSHPLSSSLMYTFNERKDSSYR